MTNYDVRDNYEAYIDSVELNVSLAELQARGGKVSKIALCSEWRGTVWLCDVSYVQGRLPNGDYVQIRKGDFYQFTYQCRASFNRELKARLIRWCKEEKAYGKAIGIFDAYVRNLD